MQNHGLVIPEEKLKRLFDAAGPSPDNEVLSGHHLGLGLCIVHAIITAHPSPA